MSALMLLGLGLGCIVAEIFFGSFFLLFIGMGLCITAGIEAFIGFGDIMGDSVESVCMASIKYLSFFSALPCCAKKAHKIVVSRLSSI